MRSDYLGVASPAFHCRRLGERSSSRAKPYFAAEIRHNSSLLPQNPMKRNHRMVTPFKSSPVTDGYLHILQMKAISLNTTSLRTVCPDQTNDMMDRNIRRKAIQSDSASLILLPRIFCSNSFESGTPQVYRQNPIVLMTRAAWSHSQANISAPFDPVFDLSRGRVLAPSSCPSVRLVHTCFDRIKSASPSSLCVYTRELQLLQLLVSRGSYSGTDMVPRLHRYSDNLWFSSTGPPPKFPRSNP
ncbi:hypothetical protein DFH11DRAFT_1601572 [Phellopilus nigrolimitatus]|nr:hypothetical protein DFH11DRAFT_1601572 [Phellopilus nigrolimitatus]